MQEQYLTDEHRMFRDAVRRFLAKEVVPHHEQWEKDGLVSREVWRKAGENGFLCMDVPEEYGGLGVTDYRYNAILAEEMSFVGASGPGFGVANELVVPYLLAFGSEEQKSRWLPQMASGEVITALAMTEPDAGSDLQAARTTAIRDGDHYVLNGQKTFISNGILNDLAIVYCKTTPGEGARGTSLLLVERGMAGYERGRNLDKMGRHAQDTAELFFHNVRVPVSNRLGEEGQGFRYLMHNLPQERLLIALAAFAAAEAAFRHTVDYCQTRQAFGRPIGKFQNSRFKLAEMKTKLTVGRDFLDQCIMEQNERALTAEKAAMAKLWCTDIAKEVIDDCVQLHGGYGYMLEYPVAKFYLDVRVDPIHGGTNEIMKEIIGRSLGF
ncbi:MAG: acyl-CoA dehydrogenase family protein [Anaerolineales bacterium]|nr:acyl-CoA dehydrogenase family protein [Anaerolineales bacterium]